jgi:hypothetical protein
MFGSNVLDIAVGMIFTYLIMGLVVTAANELLASMLSTRSKYLVRGIAGMFGEEFKNLKKVQKAGQSTWAAQFFSHPLIDALAEGDHGPAYIPSKTFVQTLLHICGAGNLPGTASFNDIRQAIGTIQNQMVQKALLPLVQAAEANIVAGITRTRSDLQAFTDEVEVWFDHAMDRVGGWYKRKAQFVVFGIAVTACVLLNVDSVALWEALSTNDTLRSSVVEAAKQYSAREANLEASSAPTGQKTPIDLSQSLQNVKTQVAQLDALKLPIGWRYDDPQAHDRDLHRVFESDIPFILSKLLGIMLTAFAASLGAPFWFDILNKFMSIRGAGRAPKERPKDPKEVLPPQAPDTTHTLNLKVTP